MISQNLNKNHPITLAIEEDKITISTLKGKKIASLKVETMEKDNEPTENFYLKFSPESRADLLDKDIVSVIE